jgi:aminopeptidase
VPNSYLSVQEFAPKGDWMHMDIAGIMGTSENLPYLSKGMTGRPTRTLVEFISSLAKSGAGSS